MLIQLSDAVQCPYCGHTWIPRTDQPSMCARCKKPLKDMPVVEVLELECLRCGHVWVPRTDDVRTCPGCQSPFWDMPPKGRPGWID